MQINSYPQINQFIINQYTFKFIDFAYKTLSGSVVYNYMCYSLFTYWKVNLYIFFSNDHAIYVIFTFIIRDLCTVCSYIHVFALLIIDVWCVLLN